MLLYNTYIGDRTMNMIGIIDGMVMTGMADMEST